MIKNLVIVLILNRRIFFTYNAASVTNVST